MRHEHWPLFALRVTTARVELRYLDDDLAESLVSLAANIHDPAFVPFTVAWTDFPEPQLQQEALRFYWQSRAGTRPESWRLQFAVIVEGAPIGMCDLTAEHFPTLRQFETGSWLARDRQGSGIGTEMRRAALHLGFVGLDADYATTGAWHDNGPSLGVTRKLGYREEGRRRALRRNAPDELIGFRMDRAHHDTIRRDDIELHGIAAAREFLGL
ncbi:MAG: GNAT family N-acetyltransferase [Actinomycetota bacterium]